MKADTPFAHSELFFLPKPGAPADSWWATAARENFTAMVIAHHLPRMQGSEFGKRGVVMCTAREIGTSEQVKRKTARRRAL